jgi:hypothetical protein
MAGADRLAATQGRVAVRHEAGRADNVIHELAVDREGAGHAAQKPSDTHLWNRLRGRRRRHRRRRHRRRRHGRGWHRVRVWLRRRRHRIERKSDVVIAAGGVRDPGPAIDANPKVGAVGDAAAADLAPAGVAQAERVASVVPTIEVAQRGATTVGEAVAGAAVAGSGRLIVRQHGGG